MFHVRGTLIPLSFLAFVLQDKWCLLGFSILSSLFNFTFASVEIFAFPFQFGLVFEYLPILFCFDGFVFFLKSIILLSFFLVALAQITTFTRLVSYHKLQFLIQMRLFPLKRLDFDLILLSFLCTSLLDIFCPLTVFGFHLLKHLLMTHLCAWFVVQMHFLLKLKRLLELLLQVFKISFRLISLAF